MNVGYGLHYTYIGNKHEINGRAEDKSRKRHRLKPNPVLEKYTAQIDLKKNKRNEVNSEYQSAQLIHS